MSKSKGRRLSEWLRNLDSNSRAGSNTLADDSVGSDQLAHDLALQGNPTAATQSSGNNSTRLATTAFVATEVAALVDSAPGTLNTLNELAAALGDDANFSTTVTNSIATKAPLASPALTGTPTAPTASSGTNTTQVATTAFVTAATSGLATDANVANKAPINSPTFTGTPAAPTASAGTNTTQIATTAFVTTAVSGASVAGISSSADATAITIDSSENVGIGESSPTSKLHVRGTSGAGSRVHIRSEGAGLSSFDGSGSGLLLTANGMNTTSKFTPSIQFGSTDPQFTTTNPKVGAAINGVSSQTYSQDDRGGMHLAFYTTPNDPGTGQTTTERMRIDSSGNVGIGISSLVNPLQVGVTPNTTSKTSGSVFDGAALRLDGNLGSADAEIGILAGANDGLSSGIGFARQDGSTWGTQIRFYTHSTAITTTDELTERVRIDASGNVGIGQTSPTATLDVNGTIKLDGNYPVGDGNVALGDTALDSLTSGDYNTAVGRNTLTNCTSGGSNTAVGNAALGALTISHYNTALGFASCLNVTTASYNTGLGASTLRLTTTGDRNTAAGYDALKDNTTGSRNTAIGYASLANNTTGLYNQAFGYLAMNTNTTGSYNTALGYHALYSNNADGNVAMGYAALNDNSSGIANTSIGYNALKDNTTGNYNTAVGNNALGLQTTTTHNTAMGYYAGYDTTSGTRNAFFGNYAGYNNTTASYSACVGYNAGYNITTNGYHAFLGDHAGSNTTGSGYGNVCVGYNTQAGSGSNTQRYQSIVLGYNTLGVGNGYFTFGTGTGNSRVYNGFGSNASWTRVSDQRYKKDIQNNTNCGLAFINDLRPVTFKWKPKSEIDNTLPDYDADATEAEYTSKMYGLIAQEVKQVLDNHNITDFGGWHEDEDSGIQGISQEMFIYPLIKAVQELSAKVTALENAE